MRKLLLASVATLGATMALVSVASAQVTSVYTGVTAGGPPWPGTISPTQTPAVGAAFIGNPGWEDAGPNGPYYPGFGPPLSQANITVRFVGRMLAYIGIASDSGRYANVTVNPPGSISTTAAGIGSIGGPAANTKLAPYGAFEYARLYPSFDAVAANGLKYGAFLEIRQDNQSPPGGGANGSISGEARSRAELYFRRETSYVGTDQLGYLRFGGTDQPTSLFLTGNFENFDDGGWNGDPALITGNAELTWPFEDVGNLYTTTKIVYVSPMFFNMLDFGISYAPSSGNNGEDSTPGNCPYGVTANNGIVGPLLSNVSLGCDSAAATTVASEAGRPKDIVDAVVRLKAMLGPVGFVGTAGGFFSGHVLYDGQNYGQAGGPSTQVTKYNGYAVADFGLQFVWGGLAFGGHTYYGRTNNQFNLQPNGGRDAWAGLIGASYTMGSNVVGFHLFEYQYDGAWNQGNAKFGVGRSRNELGLAIGDTFTVAPGAYLMLSYLYGTQHQSGVDLYSGATSSSSLFVKTNNNTRAQGIWAGTMFKW